MSETETDVDQDRMADEWAAAMEESGDAGGSDAKADATATESDAGDGEAGDDLDMADIMSVPEDEEAEGNEGGGTRILNQDEIDSLLGFDEEDGDEGSNTGVMALVNNALVNYERLPMLDRVFERLGRFLSTSLRNLTSDNVEASIDDVSSVRFGDYLNSVPLPAMLSIFKAEEWDNQGLLIADSSLIYSIVDVLLGGRRGNPAMRIEGRPYTTIEQTLVERMLHVVLNDLSAAFDPLSPVTFRFDRLETNPRFAAITQPNNAAVLAKIRIDMDDRGGMLELVIPYATLEPIRELLLQMFIGEKFGRDSIWENHLSKELYKTKVNMDAVLDEITLSLNDVMNWRIGSTVLLEAKVNDLVEVRCGARPLFTGRVGRKDKNIAVKLEEEIVIDNEDED